jgi:predicted transposase/invertase (TIGR01784 family)
MNPIEKLQNLRDFIHKDATLSTIKKLSGSGAAYVVNPAKSGKKIAEKDDKATAFLTEMVARFDEIKTSFPKARYDGTMDFVCQLESGGYALVEMQVIPKNYWDRRALAYVAAFCGHQLSKGQKWKDIRKVIGVNILGGGKDDMVHWSDTPGHFMRHYKFEDQLNGKNRFVDGIELIQYSIMQAPTVTDRKKQDWFTFFKEARYMSEDDVKSKIKTPAVLQAFERAKISKLPISVQTACEAEDEEYDQYSQHTAEQTAEQLTKGIEQATIEITKKMLNLKRLIEEIMEITGLSKEQIERLTS